MRAYIWFVGLRGLEKQSRTLQHKLLRILPRSRRPLTCSVLGPRRILEWHPQRHAFKRMSPKFTQCPKTELLGVVLLRCIIFLCSLLFLLLLLLLLPVADFHYAYAVRVRVRSTQYEYAVPVRVRSTSTQYQYSVPVRSTSTQYQYRYAFIFYFHFKFPF